MVMLPIEFSNRNPQRVCRSCSVAVAPFQESLVSTVSNHVRVNSINLNGGFARYLNMPFSKTLGSEIRKAAYAIHNMCQNSIIPDHELLLKLLRQARGLAFLTIAKIGFLIAARVGTGLVVARSPNGEWSAPSAIGTIGLSCGLLAGADLTDYLLILGDDEAVESFYGRKHASLGAEVGVALGAVGRSGLVQMSLGDRTLSSCYSYSQSKGAFAGAALEGSVVLVR